MRYAITRIETDSWRYGYENAIDDDWHHSYDPASGHRKYVLRWQHNGRLNRMIPLTREAILSRNILLTAVLIACGYKESSIWGFMDGEKPKIHPSQKLRYIPKKTAKQPLRGKNEHQIVIGNIKNGVLSIPKTVYSNGYLIYFEGEYSVFAPRKEV